MECNDLLLGGTLSSTGITGNMSINDSSLSVGDWSTLFGTVGQSGTLVEVYGRPGSYIAGDRLPRNRLLTLLTNVHGIDPETCSSSELALLTNTDALLELISQRDGTYLEVVLPDSSRRFTHVINLDPGPMQQPRSRRSFAIPLVAPWGHWWSGGNESTDTISGADSIVVGGNQPIYDAVLVFAGDGTFTHSGLGWAIEIDGSSGPVTVDLGNRTVTEGGLPATNRMRRTPIPGDGRIWGWFEVGANAVTSDVSVVVTWRNQWL